MKKLLVRSLVLTAILALTYSVFWFYLIGQVEKKIENFTNQNSPNIQIGSLSVSGFPLSQKIIIKNLSFTIPSSAFNNFKVIVPLLNIGGDIMGKAYKITLPQSAKIEYDDGIVADIKFNSHPAISYQISESQEDFNYSDSGYKITYNQDLLFESSESKISINIKKSNTDQPLLSANIEFRDIEGFDIIDIYKNSFEKEVIEGIKTGEIILSTVTLRDPTGDDLVKPETDIEVKEFEPEEQYNDSSPQSSDLDEESETIEIDSDNNAKEDGEIGPKLPEPKIDTAVNTFSKYMALKNNIKIDLDIKFLSGGVDISDIRNPAQDYQSIFQYDKIINVKKVALENNLYKILVNGEMFYFSEDKKPSGSLKLAIYNSDNLISHLSSAFLVIAQERLAEIQGSSSDLLGMYKGNDDIYKNFLERLSKKLPEISKDLVAKSNSRSKDNLSGNLQSNKKSKNAIRLEVTREKNLEFLINKTPIRELMGML